MPSKPEAQLHEKEKARATRRGPRGIRVLRCNSSAPESAFSVQRASHAHRTREIPSCAGRGRHRKTRRILRYTLREDGRELVEFSEEYEFTRKYIAFEQLRYGNRLTVTLRIDPESFDFDIPPFSIQTLAENAVLHAISVRPEAARSGLPVRAEVID